MDVERFRTIASEAYKFDMYFWKVAYFTTLCLCVHRSVIFLSEWKNQFLEGSGLRSNGFNFVSTHISHWFLVEKIQLKQKFSYFFSSQTLWLFSPTGIYPIEILIPFLRFADFRKRLTTIFITSKAHCENCTALPPKSLENLG